MNENGLTFYYLPFTILNPSNHCRKKQIGMEDTVLAQVPISYRLFAQSKTSEIYQQVPF